MCIDLTFTGVCHYISFLRADGFSCLDVECVFIGPTALGTCILARKAKKTPADMRGSKNTPGRFEGMSGIVSKVKWFYMTWLSAIAEG